jgi:hypothetical protein
MWEPRHLTTLFASTACYRDSFTFTLFKRRGLGYVPIRKHVFVPFFRLYFIVLVLFNILYLNLCRFNYELFLDISNPSQLIIYRTSYFCIFRAIESVVKLALNIQSGPN